MFTCEHTTLLNNAEGPNLELGSYYCFLAESQKASFKNHNQWSSVNPGDSTVVPLPGSEARLYLVHSQSARRTTWSATLRIGDWEWLPEYKSLSFYRVARSTTISAQLRSREVMWSWHVRIIQLIVGIIMSYEMLENSSAAKEWLMRLHKCRAWEQQMSPSIESNSEQYKTKTATRNVPRFNWHEYPHASYRESNIPRLCVQIVDKAKSLATEIDWHYSSSSSLCKVNVIQSQVLLLFCSSHISAESPYQLWCGLQILWYLFWWVFGTALPSKAFLWRDTFHFLTRQPAYNLVFNTVITAHNFAHPILILYRLSQCHNIWFGTLGVSTGYKKQGKIRDKCIISSV